MAAQIEESGDLSYLGYYNGLADALADVIEDVSCSETEGPRERNA